MLQSTGGMYLYDILNLIFSARFSSGSHVVAIDHRGEVDRISSQCRSDGLKIAEVHFAAAGLADTVDLVIPLEPDRGTVGLAEMCAIELHIVRIKSCITACVHIRYRRSNYVPTVREHGELCPLPAEGLIRFWYDETIIRRDVDQGVCGRGYKSPLVLCFKNKIQTAGYSIDTGGDRRSQSET